MKEEKIILENEFITLGQFLKMTDFISSGGEAKIFLGEHEVLVNNEKEERRGRKLYSGMTVVIDGKLFQIA